MSQMQPQGVRKLRRVLVVMKKTTYQQEVIERQDPKALQMLAEGNPSVLQWIKTDEEHRGTLSVVEEAMRTLAIDYKLIDRSQLADEHGEYDLVIAFGGDGTFLETSHGLTTTPLLGVNSAPLTSHGHWCLGRKDSFEKVLNEIADGTRLPVPVMRLEIAVNGKALPIPVLNELFFGHASPAGTTRFLLEIKGLCEDLRSSGILVGPGVGSTGWMRSAGGVVMPVTSQSFQYFVREPCVWPGENPQLLKGLLQRGDTLKMVPKMTEGKIFIDGAHIIYDISRGDEIVVGAHPHDLIAYTAPEANDSYLPG